MADFALRNIAGWRRNVDVPGVAHFEIRPHVVPLNGEAEAFIRFDFNCPCSESLFGPFFTGWSVVRVDGAERLAYRFKVADMRALRVVEAAYAEWQAGIKRPRSCSVTEVAASRKFWAEHALASEL